MTYVYVVLVDDNEHEHYHSVYDSFEKAEAAAQKIQADSGMYASVKESLLE